MARFALPSANVISSDRVRFRYFHIFLTENSRNPQCETISATVKFAETQAGFVFCENYASVGDQRSTSK